MQIALLDRGHRRRYGRLRGVVWLTNLRSRASF